MKRFALLALASGFAMAAASPANAAIFLAYQLQPGGAINAVTNTSVIPGFAQGSGSAGGFSFTFNASGFPVMNSPELTSQTITAQFDGAKTDTISLYVVQTGNTSFVGGLTSTFTSQALLGGASSVTMSTYYDTTNAVSYGGTQLATATFNTLGTSAQGSPVLALTGPFSTTIRYDLTFNSAGSFNDTAQITAVPEPATWGMMILGFGLMGGVLRRRKTSVAFA